MSKMVVVKLTEAELREIQRGVPRYMSWVTPDFMRRINTALHQFDDDSCDCDEDQWIDPWAEQGICPFPPEPGTMEYFIEMLEPFDTPLLDAIMAREKKE